MESASFDHFFVDVQEAGGANPRRLLEWVGPTMTHSVGNPVVSIPQSAGWSSLSADVSEYAGKTIELRYHVDSDTTVQLAGVAIDDVRVTRIDNDPPQTGITTHPKKRTTKRQATFKFKRTRAARRSGAGSTSAPSSAARPRSRSGS
jgi:hypothetical protein